MFRSALLAGEAEAFFPLSAHFHTQADPAWCGLGTLVTALNALGVDPGRTWKGPWRYYGEELLNCCKSLEAAKSEGLCLTELVCLAHCNGAHGLAHFADEERVETFRQAVVDAVRQPEGAVLVVNYGRAALGQTGTGHFSPIAAYERGSDRVLVMDVARFKYPPHWVPVAALFAAMATPDSATGRSRGWVTLRPSAEPAITWEEARKLGIRLESLGGNSIASLRSTPELNPGAEECGPTKPGCQRTG